ncbi:MAG TPA: integration host factor subunit alpha [Thermodesulfobacteriaceae bacterium]|nr:integration host factor subunit alpha [Thermodesulfobacteriaceae bacterium]
MTLTKADLVNRIYEKEILTKADSIKAVENFLEIIKHTLEQGDNVLISGFGKFTVKDKKQRRGRNPHTGKDLMLAPRRVVTFRPSGVLREKINKKR